MRLAPTKILLLAICTLMVSTLSWADVINFNNLPGNGTAIPNGYAGLDWNNFYDMNMNVLLAPVGAMQIAGAAPPSAGVPSSSTFAYNNGGAPATFTSANTFTFTSAWLSTDGASPMALEVLGLLDGNVVDRAMLILKGSVPVQQTFNWSGIDGVRFVPQASATSNGKLQFALNQMVINGVTAAVPEPTSMLLLGSGIGLALTSIRKRLMGR